MKVVQTKTQVNVDADKVIAFIACPETGSSERDLSARTVRYTHVVLKSAMQQALQWRLLLENPATGVKVPQQPRNEMRALTIDQARTVLKVALTTKYGPVLAVALTTGMRPSEYLGLKWQTSTGHDKQLASSVAFGN